MFGRSVGRLLGCSVGRSVGPGQSDGPSADRLGSFLAGFGRLCWLVDLLASGLSAGWLADWLVAGFSVSCS